MPILKAYHRYVIRKEYSKKPPYIDMIIPIEDREVKDTMFKCYMDVTNDTDQSFTKQKE